MVAIAAYNEKHIKQTVESLLDNKSGEHEIFINICEFRSDANFCFFQEQNINHIKHISNLPPGVGISRYMALDGAERFEYILQSDAHVIYGKSWDKAMVDRYRLIREEKNRRFVISQHVSPCQEDENGKMFKLRKNPEPAYLHLDSYHRVWSTNWIPKKFPDWKENYAVSAAYMFSESSTFIDVPPDPHMWFYGEELALFVRLYSRGIKCFSTDYVDIYHLDKGNNVFDAKKSQDWRTFFYSKQKHPVIDFMDKYTFHRTSSVLDGTLTGIWGAPSPELAKLATSVMGLNVARFKSMYEWM